MRWIGNLRRLLVVGVAMVAMTGTAASDIRSFNAAMQAKDYKTAAAEAAATWPTLDKSRGDLAIIAREFGFAAFMAGDYEAARTFAAATLAAAGDNELRIGAELLLGLSEFKLTPSNATRDKLQAALEGSATLPGIDLVTYVGINALTAYDVDNDSWTAAQVSAALGERLTGRGAGASVDNLRFGLIRASANYVVNRDVASYRSIIALSQRVFDAIDGAASDDEAAKFEPVYWQLRAWEISAVQQLDAKEDFKEDKPGQGGSRRIGARVARLYANEPPAGACKTSVPSFDQPVPYPHQVLNRGRGGKVAGVVLLKVDIQQTGTISNMRILAAVPQRYFGDAVYGVGNRIKFMKAPEATAGCSLAQKDKVFTYVFEMRN